MHEATEQFFTALPERAPAIPHVPVTGTLRIDLTNSDRTDHWLVHLGPGRVTVQRDRGPADAIWTSSADLFERMIRGQAHSLSAVLRNEATFSGNVALLLFFRTLLPHPPGVRDPRETAREQAARERDGREPDGQGQDRRG
ncbi:SCP2 sterol-binding domain-containing protein [Micromonospora sp. NPDC051925]|uniref:SCP2 sterol-binding domain-containing protein n=1 Tax=Micromonospora sp. NPDC051925 TaxID=3364288 RepID=UPI0037C780A7